MFEALRALDLWRKYQGCFSDFVKNINNLPGFKVEPYVFTSDGLIVHAPAVEEWALDGPVGVIEELVVKKAGQPKVWISTPLSALRLDDYRDIDGGEEKDFPSCIDMNAGYNMLSPDGTRLVVITPVKNCGVKTGAYTVEIWVKQKMGQS